MAEPQPQPASAAEAKAYVCIVCQTVVTTLACDDCGAPICSPGCLALSWKTGAQHMQWCDEWKRAGGWEVASAARNPVIRMMTRPLPVIDAPKRGGAAPAPPVETAASPAPPQSPDARMVVTWAAAKPARFSAVRAGWNAPGFTVSAEARAVAAGIPQTDPRWLNLRDAFLTATAVSDATGVGYVPGRKGIINAFGFDAGVLPSKYVTKEMKYGKLHENKFRRAYSLLVAAKTGTPVRECGLVICPLPGMGHFASSPDGLVGTDGILEIKTTMHADGQSLGNTHFQAYWFPQVQFNLLCTGRAWCDVLGCYRPEDNVDRSSTDVSRIVIWHIMRDEAFIKRLCDAGNLYVKRVIDFIDHDIPLRDPDVKKVLAEKSKDLVDVSREGIPAIPARREVLHRPLYEWWLLHLGSKATRAGSAYDLDAVPSDDEFDQKFAYTVHRGDYSSSGNRPE